MTIISFENIFVSLREERLDRSVFWPFIKQRREEEVRSFPFWTKRQQSVWYFPIGTDGDRVWIQYGVSDPQNGKLGIRPLTKEQINKLNEYVEKKTSWLSESHEHNFFVPSD